MSDFKIRGPGFESCLCFHYENTPMQYTDIFKLLKMKKISRNVLIFFLFLPKI